MSEKNTKENKIDKEPIMAFYDERILEWSKPRIQRFNKLMAYYRCAMMEIETKFNVLNEEFSLRYDRGAFVLCKSQFGA